MRCPGRCTAWLVTWPKRWRLTWQVDVTGYCFPPWHVACSNEKIKWKNNHLKRNKFTKYAHQHVHHIVYNTYMSYRNANINPLKWWNKILTDNMCDVLRSKLPPGNWPLLDQWSGDPRNTRTTQTLVVSNTLRQTFSLTSNKWSTINYKPTQYQRI